MYVGRITAIGKTKKNEMVLMYRVSSRSFPNRQAKKIDESVAILPKPGHENDILENPYIAYNCLRFCSDYSVIGNGTQTDPIFEKLQSGMTTRDAMITVLSGMDYEHDHLNTPRIAAISDKRTGLYTLGIIRKDSIQVLDIALEPGTARYIATYEHDTLDPTLIDKNFDIASAEDGCDYVLGQGVFKELERPITAVCSIQSGDSFEIAFKDQKRD